MGSLERFFGVLIEHYGGAFPLWLAPEQVRILPITDKQLAAADRTAELLREQGFRVGVDRGAEKIGAKIRDAQMQKVPYMLVMGGREVEQGTVAVRSRTAGDLGAMKLEAVVSRLTEEVVGKVISDNKGTDSGSATRR
jgi:threonyl-tRNA synthetase